MNIIQLWVEYTIKLELCSVFSLLTGKHSTTRDSKRTSYTISKMRTIKALRHRQTNEEIYAFKGY